MLIVTLSIWNGHEYDNVEFEIKYDSLVIRNFVNHHLLHVLYLSYEPKKLNIISVSIFFRYDISSIWLLIHLSVPGEQYNVGQVCSWRL